jgi:hypothetical protein|tara:strand:- start:4622 stop:5584 length:963 start_codon:yes stop_codon:yes gene_type:complete
MDNEQVGSQTPYANPEANPAMDNLQAAEQSVTATANEVNAAKERVSFERYVQDQGQTIPENFQDAGAWFDSLKHAQGQYTQARQEIADLKGQYSEEGTVNPGYVENTAPVAEPQQQNAEPTGNEELRLSLTDEAEAAPEEAQAAFSDADWDKWGYEMNTTGKLSEETVGEIKTKTNFSDRMISDFVTGQKAKMREAFTKASNIVGGGDKLGDIMKWAEGSMSPEERLNINAGLASPGYEVVLRGLDAQYNHAMSQKPTANEPSHMPNRQPVAETQTATPAYGTKREFNVDRNNPRFRTDPKYREAVEQRMMRTDWNNLPQ